MIIDALLTIAAFVLVVGLLYAALAAVFFAWLYFIAGLIWCGTGLAWCWRAAKARWTAARAEAEVNATAGQS